MSIPKYALLYAFAASLITPGAAMSASSTRSAPLTSANRLARTEFVQRSIVPNQQSPVSFNTYPHSICQKTIAPSRDDLRIASDQYGVVSYYVNVSGPSHVEKDSLVCFGPSGAERINIAYIPNGSRPLSRLRPAMPIPNAAVMDEFVLAHGFDPRTASNDVLWSHFLPPRPDDYATSTEKSVTWLIAAFSPISKIYTSGTSIAGESHPPVLLRGGSGLSPDGSVIKQNAANYDGFNAEGVQGTYNTIRA